MSVMRVWILASCLHNPWFNPLLENKPTRHWIPVVIMLVMRKLVGYGALCGISERYFLKLLNEIMSIRYFHAYDLIVNKFSFPGPSLMARSASCEMDEMEDIGGCGELVWKSGWFQSGSDNLSWTRHLTSPIESKLYLKLINDKIINTWPYWSTRIPLLKLLVSFFECGWRVISSLVWWSRSLIQ